MQHALHAATESLSANGYRYPIVDQGTSQSGSVLALARRGWGWQARGSRALPARVWKNLVKAVRHGNDNIILSSEFFSELDDAQVQKVRDDFAGLDCQVVFTLRAFDKLFASTYQQALKSGSSYSYEFWLERTIRDYWGEQKFGFWKRNRHAAVISRWMQIFGAENITVITADEENPGLLFDRFNQYLGLPTETLKPLANSGLNRSLLLDEIALLRSINSKIPKSRSWNAYMTFVRRGIFEQFTATPAGKVAATERLRTPRSFAKQIAKIAAVEHDALAALDLRVIGSLEDLKVGTAPIGNNAEPEAVAIDKVAAVMANYDFDLLKFVSPRAMSKNWLPYFETRAPKWLYRPTVWLVQKIL